MLVRCTALVAVVGLCLSGCTIGRTDSADQITAHQALLHGTVVSNHDETGSFWFDVAPVGQSYGAPSLHDVEYTSQEQVPVSLRQNGLVPGTDYKFRVCSKDSDSTSAHPAPPGCGATKFFSTPAAPTAAVSLGDSYISGEAGRWQGNSINPAGSRDGTDRAFTGTGYDESLVYDPPSDTNGCHRSDVAEIRSASLAVAQRVNLACSGAVTKNIFRASNGGEGQDGELPQADQLATVARDKDVKLIALSIGGNDLGFASIVTACVEAYADEHDSLRGHAGTGARREVPGC